MNCKMHYFFKKHKILQKFPFFNAAYRIYIKFELWKKVRNSWKKYATLDNMK